MEEQKVQQMLDELQQACPKYEISIRTTQRRGDVRLIVIQGFSSHGDIDSWAVDVVSPIWWDIVLKCVEKHKLEGNLRTLFIRENQFVFYSPDTGTGSVFEKMEKPVNFEVYGGEYHRYYVGECEKMEDVINYLTQVTGVIF